MSARSEVPRTSAATWNRPSSRRSCAVTLRRARRSREVSSLRSFGFWTMPVTVPPTLSFVNLQVPF